MMPYALEFLALGTRWQISTDDALTADAATRILQRVETFDRTYSRFRPDSLVAEVRRRPGTHDFPADATALFALYRQLYDCTDGAVTPLIGRTLEHLGYGSDYRLTPAAGGMRTPRWDDVLTIEGSTLTTTEPVLLDVGAAGKGHLVDLLAELLDSENVTAYVIDASGDLLHRGPSVERVGLEDPDDPRRVIGVAAVQDLALCASATTRRRWGDGLHHIIDPATGSPVSSVRATWSTHASCAVADGLATALFLASPVRLNRSFDFGYIRLHENGGLEYSADFDGQIFT